MSESAIRTIPGVAEVSTLRGAAAPSNATAGLLVEVPHGADRRADYDALRARLVGDLPRDLHEFFHFNTDVAAWAYGLATAQEIVGTWPDRTVLLVRCLIPRTLIDCNRALDANGDARLTAGLPAYIRDPRDRALLRGLHAAYVDLVDAAYRTVCGSGGIALVPHTYGPHTVELTSIDDDIVDQLRAALAPDRAASWPLRPEVDLLTRDDTGLRLAPDTIEQDLQESFRAAGFDAQLNATYCLQPPTLVHHFATTYPRRVICLEVRRDLLTAWRPFEEMVADPAQVARVAGALAPVVGPRLGH